MVKPGKKRPKPARSMNGAPATIELAVYDGTRQPFTSSKEILLRVRDGQQQEQVSKFVKGANFRIEVPFFENLFDNYTVLVTCDGYRDAGFFPVKVSSTLDSLLDLMLVPKHAKYSFLPWPDLVANFPQFTTFLVCVGNQAEVRGHYEDLARSKPAGLASLLNLTAAMSVIHLPIGTPLDYFKRIEWDDSLAEDRFFGFADARIVQQVKTAAQQGAFAPEPSPGIFHSDATSSFKQVQFGEANVQLTFHENTIETINGVRCIRIEPDIDYYKDLGAHALLEVIPNTLRYGLTDPQVVYVLRWIAGRHAGVPEFDPSYTLV